MKLLAFGVTHLINLVLESRAFKASQTCIVFFRFKIDLKFGKVLHMGRVRVRI